MDGLLRHEFPQARVLIVALPPRKGPMNAEVLEVDRDLREDELTLLDPWGGKVLTAGDDLHLDDEAYQRWAATF